MPNSMLTFAFILILNQLACYDRQDDFFAIGAFGTENIPEARSCNFNIVLFWYDSQDRVDRRLDQADELGMRIILGRAKLPETSDITGISGGQRAVYEAESNTFAHDYGNEVFDPEASNGSAWAVSTRSAVWLQHDLWTDEQYLFQPIRFKYYAYFTLKVNNNRNSRPVCSLAVRRKENNKIITESSRLLHGTDFMREGIYDTFLVNFDLNPGQGSKIDYAIKYLGNGDSLFSDRVDVMDVVAHKLKEGDFDKDISSIASYYNQHPALYRYYMWDELTRDQMWASGQVQRRLVRDQDSYRGGIQVLYVMDVLTNYLDSVRTKELLVDFYPLYGRTNYYGRTPVDGGPLFQKRLTDMCNLLGVARYQVKSHPGTRLWFMPQAFGHVITNQSYRWDRAWDSRTFLGEEGWWREPTPRELRCMVWLSLAYGAKGVLYYRYQSHKEHYDMPELNRYKDDHWILGLTDPTGKIKRPSWMTVKSLNEELAKIGDILISLTSDTVFSSNSPPPRYCPVKKVTDTLVHVATFHDSTHEYIMVVNRQCMPKDTAQFEIRIKDEVPIVLFDCSTGRTLVPVSMPAENYYDFELQFEPGQGRLFRIDQQE